MPSRTCMGRDLLAPGRPGLAPILAASAAACTGHRRRTAPVGGAYPRPGDHRDPRRARRAPARLAAPVAARLDPPVVVTLVWVPLVLLLDRGAGIWEQRALGLGTWLLLLALLRRETAAGAGPGRGRRGLRDRGRVHLLAAARGLRLPAGQRAGLRPAGARPGLPVRAGDRPVGLGAPAYRRCWSPATVLRRRPVRRVGAVRLRPAGRPRRVLVPLPARASWPGAGPARSTSARSWW